MTGLSNINNRRNSHSCGVIKDTETGDKILVVAGGYSFGSTTASTEMLSLDNAETASWIHGQDLPKPSVMTRDGYTMLFIGGGRRSKDDKDKTIYRYRCSNWICEWTLMEQELELAREYFFAAIVPASLVECF